MKEDLKQSDQCADETGRPDDCNLVCRMRRELCRVGRCSLYLAPKTNLLFNGHFYHSDCRGRGWGGELCSLHLLESLSERDGRTAEELRPFGQIHQGGLLPCFHISTDSCTQAPSQISRYHQSGDVEISTRSVIRTTCDSRRGVGRSEVGPWGVH